VPFLGLDSTFLTVAVLVAFLGLVIFALSSNKLSSDQSGRVLFLGGAALFIFWLFLVGGSGSDCPDPADCDWGR
jgi:hypothetical protein